MAANTAQAADRTSPRFREFMCGEVIRSYPGAPTLPQGDDWGLGTGPRPLQFERPFRNRRQLLAQREDLVLPIARLDEPGERGRERRVGPAPRQPRGVMNHAQRAQ